MFARSTDKTRCTASTTIVVVVWFLLLCSEVELKKNGRSLPFVVLKRGKGEKTAVVYRDYNNFLGGEETEIETIYTEEKVSRV